MATDSARAAQTRIRLATYRGKRLPLDGQLVKREPPLTLDLDLVRPPLREFSVPHRHGLSGDAEYVSEGLVRSAEEIDDLLEGDLGFGHMRSVSTLPAHVKQLPPLPAKRHSKLAYMTGKRLPKDPWAIARGEAMKAARQALGLSQAKVARLAGIKDRETISQYESGKIADIDSAVIPALSKALGMPVAALARDPINVRDEGADLRVGPVARQIAYNWDDFPLGLQNAIRHQIANYETAVAQMGKEAASALYGGVQPRPQSPARTAEPRKVRSR